jgi:hypothetical protein
MQTMKRWFYRLAAVAVEIAQAIVTIFGGGNGDPTVLHEQKKPLKS